MPSQDWSYPEENIWAHSGQFCHCPVPKKSWEGRSQPTAEHDVCQFEDADPSVLGVLRFLTVLPVPLGWRWFCASGKDDDHVVVFIWRGCAAAFRQHYAPNWEFKFQLVDWGWKAELWDRNGQAQNAEAPNLLQYVCLIQSGLLRLFCRVE